MTIQTRTDPAPFLIALAQMNPRIREIEVNRAVMLQKLAEAAEQGARLIVFPECALSGYVFGSAEEALPASETVPGPSSEILSTACRKHSIYAVVGMLERDGDRLYNTAIVLGPDGLVARYRKCHLPVLGVDRFVERGSEISVIDLPFARIGILICYDIRFPEAARLLTLQGADVILVPTNWPQGAESAPEFLTRARAWENRVYVAACNRVGEEKSARFIGLSHVVTPNGKFIAQADGHSEMTLMTEIDPAFSRQKRLVIIPGEFELDPVGGRRPELYGALSETP